ncbi:MAG TPA: enolase C-terminal domain-like protein [Solirubrobacteraceae bacterium]|jgi:L-alanine-DL-glutamate epimerase-like enolase superfamily enzyme
MPPSGAAHIEQLEVQAYTIPTDAPEGDGTLRWDSTTIVVVHAHAGGTVGLGYTYADVSTARLIESKLAGVVRGLSARAPARAWSAMVHAIRNLGRPGIASMAISAVDVALWDLHARLLGAPLASVLGAAHECVPVYGSGGFTAYADERLQEQLAAWVEQGIPRVKMKVGAHPHEDPRRVRAARAAIGGDAELMVDANGAYSRKQALALAELFAAECAVSWLEEPVSSDDLVGLRLLRDRAPAGMAIAAGEYGYDAPYFLRMLEAGAVDVLQADITRCGGVSELLRIGGLAHARCLPLSCHCGPAIHVHPACAVESLLHLEYFHDHTRIEQMLFDGLPELRDGALWPDLGRPGIGLELKRADAERFAV